MTGVLAEVAGVVGVDALAAALPRVCVAVVVVCVCVRAGVARLAALAADEVAGVVGLDALAVAWPLQWS